MTINSIIKEKIGVNIINTSNAQEHLHDIGYLDGRGVLITDKNIAKNCQDFIRSIADKIDIIEFDSPKCDEKTLDDLCKKIDLDSGYKKILGLGSGSINDLCKLASKKTTKPYSIIPSAPSMNGYVSRNGSILLDGYKTSIPGELPQNVILNLSIIGSAPEILIKAGIGDSVCFYACWFDWLLSHLILETHFDPEPFFLLKDKVDLLIYNYEDFSIKSDEFLLLLMEILLLSGCGMTMCGGSYPASQSEHAIAHFIEMKYGKRVDHIPHGLQIADTVISSAQMQKKIIEYGLDNFPKSVFPYEKFSLWFGEKVANACKEEYEEKLEKLSKAKFDKNKIIPAIKEVYVAADLIKKSLTHFGIKWDNFLDAITKEEYEEALENAKFVRKRFGALDCVEVST